MKKLADIFKSSRLPNSGKTGRGTGRGMHSSGSVFNFLSLVEAWPSIVGERLANHTIPIKNVRQVLTILTDHPAYGQQLSFMEIELIKKVTGHFPRLKGCIKKIRFQTNPVFFQKQMLQKQKSRKYASPPKELHKFSPRYQELKRDAQRLLTDIDDKELHDYLESIYIQSEL